MASREDWRRRAERIVSSQRWRGNMPIVEEHTANAARAKELYLAGLGANDDAIDWHTAVRLARRHVASTLRASSFMTDILDDRTVVHWMGRLGPHPGVCCGVGDMPFLPGDGNEPATRLR